jgi:outer membrane receptor for ferrienterochelin and colicin
MRYSLLGFLLLWMNTLSFGQQGTLVGEVTDKKTSEGVIGATVLVTGTIQAAPVNVDGSYSLLLDAGTYNITMTYVGYKPLTFSGIVIKSGEATTLNGSMEESATSLTEVTVTGVKQTGTEVAMIQDLKKSEVVVSGMSSDQIVKTLDRDASEVVKRIPGVTIQNNSFIVIRGLAERYNTVMLNDALTPSAEVDTRSFSFDILPSSVIDRILIFKSGAPELPAEFGGGVVKVYTKNSVLENTTNFTISGWSRTGTTFKSGYQQAPSSGTDWVGYDNGLRQEPGQVKTEAFDPNAPLSNDQLHEAALGLRQTWKPTLQTALPDLRASLGITRKFELGRLYLSNVTSVSYANTREQYSIQRQRFETGGGGVDGKQPLIYDYNDLRALTGTRLGVIHNWQARLDDHNRIDFRNFLNQYGTNEAIHRTGVAFDQGGDGQERDNYSLHYQSRTVYSGQLGGTHDLGSARQTTLTWGGGYNYVFRDEPDYRRFRTQRDVLPAGQDRGPFRVVVPSSGNQFDNSSYFSKLSENTYQTSAQLERRLRGRDTTQVNQYKLRAGYYAEYKERAYDSRFFSYVRGSGVPSRLLNLPIEEIFQPQNISDRGGFKLAEGTSGVDSYRADNTLLAGYLSAVAPVSDRFSVSGGVRVEYNRKFLRSGDDSKYEEKRTFLLPSVNATYNFNQRSLLRLAGSSTLNRPEFREIAPYTYYDFSIDANIQGNIDLKTARIYNADLRYEFYPSRSELLSVGVFYKYFLDAIEQTTVSTSGSSLTLGYLNADKAYDLGVEVEARKGLVELTENPFLQHISFVLNASLIKSAVTLTNAGGAFNGRPLQGQSPYVVNAGVFYQDDDRRWQVSAQYNVIGPRIQFVSDNGQNFSVFDLPRHVVDLALTKGLGPHLDLRVGIQDLLNQYTRQYYDFDRNGRINGGDSGVFGQYRKGQYTTVGLTFKL